MHRNRHLETENVLYNYIYSEFQIDKSFNDILLGLKGLILQKEKLI